MRLLERIRRAISEQSFHPGPLGTLVNPFYFARRGLLEAIAVLAPRVRGRILDVGCGSKPYRDLFDADEYIGLEIDAPGLLPQAADFLYDGKSFPFQDASFDSVVCFEVLEHVFEPMQFLDEIRRVLKPRGTILLTTPFVWDEHHQPYDFARYSSFGLRHLLEQHGFDILSATKTCPDVRALFQLWNAYAYKVVDADAGRLQALGTMLLTAPMNVAGLVAHRVMPNNLDLYLDNVVLAERK